MKDSIKDAERLSHRNVWAAILYLDPERECEHGEKSMVIPMIACFSFSFIFFGALYALSIRARGGDPELFHFSSSSEQAARNPRHQTGSNIEEESNGLFHVPAPPGPSQSR